MKGLILNVLRSSGGDCTNGGPTSRVSEITVINLGKDSEIFEPTPERPAFKLEMHVRGCLRLVPVDEPKGMCSGMFGGNYATTSDGRFGAACEKLLGTRFYGAVAVHDRSETWAQYNSNAD